MWYFHFNLPPSSYDEDIIANTSKTWNQVYEGLTDEPVLDPTGVASSLTYTVPAGLFVYNNIFGNSPPTWTGDASWDDEAADDSWKPATGTWETGCTVSGFDSSKSYVVEILAPNAYPSRTMSLRVNGGTPVEFVQSTDPAQDTIKFTVSGTTSIQIEGMNVTGGNTYVKSFRIYEDIPLPGVTISGSLEPGAAISGTFENFAGTPTVLTITDSQGNIISSASEITDLSVDAVNETFTFTMPNLPSSGSAQGLLFGDVTVELS